MRSIVCIVIAFSLLILQAPTNDVTLTAHNAMTSKVVDRLIIEDPADCDGESNDISLLNVWVNREYSEEHGKQIRQIAWYLHVHNKFESTPEKLMTFTIFMEWSDREGNINTNSIGYYLPPFGSSTYGWVGNDGCDYESDFCLTKIEDETDIRIGTCKVYAETGYLVYCEDVDGYVDKLIDTTKITDDYLDVSDNRQAKNVINLVGVSDKKCIKLSWDKPEIKEHEMDYDWYRIYRDNEQIMTVYGTTEYRDCNVEPGNTYKYSVRPLTKWLIEGSSTICKVGYNPMAIIKIDREEIDFGNIEPNTEVTQTLTFSNSGVIDGDIVIETEADWLTIEPNTFTVQPDESVEVKLTTIPEKMLPETRHQAGIEASWGEAGYKPMYAQIRVGRDTTPPMIALDPLEDVTNATEYTISGTVEENCRVVINGKEAEVDGTRFTVSIPLDPAPSKTPVTVWSSDIYDNVLDETIGHVTNIMDRVVNMTIGNTIMSVDGKKVIIDPSPTIISGRTMVPVRAVAEAFGAQVDWDGETKTVIINLFGSIIMLPIGKTTAMVDGKEKEVDPPAQILNGRTMVPFRFTAEAIGAEVEWDGETKTITMNLVVSP